MILLSFSKVLTSNALSALVAFFISVVLIRFFPADISGEVLAFYSYIVVMAGFIEFGAGNSFLFLEGKGFCRKKLFGLFLVQIFFLAVFCSVVFLKYFSQEYSLLIICSSILYAVLRFGMSIFQASNLFSYYAFINLALNFFRFCSVIVVAICFASHIDADLLIKILFFCSILLLFIITIWHIEKNKLLQTSNANSDPVNFLKKTIPIGVISLVTIFMMRGEPVIIDYFMGHEAVPFYIAGSSIALLVPLVTTSMMSVLIPYAAKGALSLEMILSIRKKLAPIVISLLALSYLLSDWIVIIIYGVEYVKSGQILFMLSSCFIISMLFTPLESHLIIENSNIAMFLKIFQFFVYALVIILTVDEHNIMALVYSAIICRVFNWISLSVIYLRRNLQHEK